MKRSLLILTAVVMALLLPLAPAQAKDHYTIDENNNSTYWDNEADFYRFAEPHYGIVICSKMNVRDQPSTRGSVYGSIRNGQPVKVLGISEGGDFYALDLESCGIHTARFGYGYAKMSLIVLDPQFIQASKLLNLYATPWGEGMKNGEQSGRYFLVVSQYNNWYAVQTTESSPGTSFIRARDITTESLLYKFVVTWDTIGYEPNTMQPAQTVKRFSFGTLLDRGEDYTMLQFNTDTPDEFRALIPNQYVAPIIN